MATVIHWFRRDLRLADNTALLAAVRTGGTVLPVYVFDPLEIEKRGAPPMAFLLQCVEALQKNLEAAGSRLIIRSGKPWEELWRVGKEAGATSLYFNRAYEPAARERDAEVETKAGAVGWDVRIFKDDLIQEPPEVLKADGKPYVVFTPYSAAWKSRPVAPVLPVAKFRQAPDRKITSEPLPTLSGLGKTLTAEIPPGGEKAARDRLKTFISQGVAQYAQRRDFPAVDGTSLLSPHLRFGTVSARTVMAAAQKAADSKSITKNGVDSFVKELIWREFYVQVLWHFPHVANSCFRPQLNDICWENNLKYFRAWCSGRTGFPLIDAAMRQLNTTGWMHNRLRMIVAMFLTKDLLIDWKWGERYFMEKLVDADLASNNGGWQWSAGTGTDAAPYFRIFNPNNQTAKFDPEGEFIQRLVPEVDSPAYPQPIVNHSVQRVKALALYR